LTEKNTPGIVKKGGSKMSVKTKKCQKCNNETYQDDNVCVLCKIGVTQMYRELDELVRKNTKWNTAQRKAAGAR